MATQELKRIEVLSFAVVMGLVMAVIGLVLGILMALFGAGLGSIVGAMGVGTGAAFGALVVIILPIMMFIEGFIGGAIFALVYNFIADKYKGIGIELK